MVTESAWGDLAPNVRDALEAIHGGATADSQESLILEFKEDPAVREGEKGAEGEARREAAEMKPSAWQIVKLQLATSL